MRPLQEQPKVGALLLLLPVLGLTLAVLLGYFLFGERPGVFVGDPNALAKQPAYYGLLSNVGAVIWTVTATVSLYTWLAMRRLNIAAKDEEVAKLLLIAGLFTVFMGADDLFMLHEGLAPSLGIPEKIVLIGYVLFTVWLTVTSARTVLRTEWMLFLLGVAGLGGSVLIDVVPRIHPVQVLAEEMAKLAGILYWSAYLLRLSWQTLTSGR